MTTSSKVQEFDQLITALNTIIFGDGDVVMGSKIKPTIDKVLKSIAENGWVEEPFPTEAGLLASVPTKSKAVAKALDTRKIWLWSNSVWTDTGLSELDLAKKHSNELVQRTVIETIAIKKSENDGVYCLVSDGVGNALVWIDKLTGQFEAVGLKEAIYAPINSLKLYSSSEVYPLAVDSRGNCLAWIEKSTGNFNAVGLNMSSVGMSDSTDYYYYGQKPASLEVNHALGYGQSLATGATAITILSAAQPYYNTTFSTGPRMDSEATAVIPLVEQFNNPSSDGYANRGETHCSGMANYASLAMYKENGVDPEDHVIFASTAGHGGYRIDQLKKGSAWYNVAINHVTKAKALNDGKTYHVPVVSWIQGENNAVQGGIQTPYDVYMPELAQMQVDLDADIRAITGQSDPVRIITYQMSYAAATWPDIAKAQLDLARENENFMLATPMYHFPYAGDNVHLTNIGYKWMGAYFGRAYKQYMIEGRKSDYINPLYAYIDGDEAIIKFNVPTLPLVLDLSSLAVTTDYGFKVVSGEEQIGILEAFTRRDEVVIKLDRTVDSEVEIRYALDYLGNGLRITGGASGNLRDSTLDTIKISGQTLPLYHVCPHFSMTAKPIKGI